MKLQVVETMTSVFNKEPISQTYIFNFENGKTYGKLNYGPAFQADVTEDNRSVIVSLVRLNNKGEPEIYSSKEVFTVNNAVFEDATSSDIVKVEFSLVK